MIKFTPSHNNSNDGTIGSFQDNLVPISEEHLSKIMNNNESMIKCNLHPNTDSLVLINMESGKPEFTIASYCCEDFRNQLEDFLSPQD